MFFLNGNIVGLRNSAEIKSLLAKYDIVSIDDGSDLAVPEMENLIIECDKGLSGFKLESDNRHNLSGYAKRLAAVLSESGVQHYLEVCDDEWVTLESYGAE